MDVDAHPHIGLSTLTYLLAGRARHRDSLGVVQTIEAGEVNWMTAGEGICHTERSLPEDHSASSDLFGIQTWVALPDGGQDVPPRFEHAGAEGTPLIDHGRSAARLLAGTGWGESAAIPGSSPLALADLRLGGDLVPLTGDHAEWAVLPLEGEVIVGGAPSPLGALNVLDPDQERVVGGSGRAIVLGGDPVGPRRIWWNFVHSDPQRIEDAKQRWLRQEFPLVPGDHDPYVPLPSS